MQAKSGRSSYINRKQVSKMIFCGQTLGNADFLYFRCYPTREQKKVLDSWLADCPTEEIKVISGRVRMTDEELFIRVSA